MIDENKQNRLDRFFKSGLSHNNFVKNRPKDDVDFEVIWDWMVENKRGAGSASNHFKVGKVRIENFLSNSEKDITETHTTRVVNGITMCHCRSCKTDKELNEENFQKFYDRRSDTTKYKTSQCKDCKNKKQRQKRTK